MNITTDNYFTYRQIPVSYKGMADITSIKGNTVVFNQLIQNGNFADTSNWLTSGSTTTLSVSNNEATMSTSTRYGSMSNNVSLEYNHTYLICADIKASSLTYTKFGIGDPSYFSSQGVTLNITPADTNYHRYALIGELVSVSGASLKRIIVMNAVAVDQTYNVKNVICIDLTQMFGSGNEPSSVEAFTSLFPLSYYTYNTGELVSFRGTGLKTTGKNLMQISDGTKTNSQNCTIVYQNNGIQLTATSNYARSGYSVRTEIGKKYTISFDGSSTGNFNQVYYGDDPSAWQVTYGNSVLNSTEAHYTKTITATSKSLFVGFYVTSNSSTGVMNVKNFQVEQSNTETSFAPYTESMLSLPISTYFPTGMKSAGSVYDELTQSKAYTRVGSVDLGSLSWEQNSTNIASTYRFKATFSGKSSNPSDTTNGKRSECKFTLLAQGETWNATKDGYTLSSDAIWIYLDAYKTSSAADFKTAMDGVYLYYELATPTETDVSLSLTYNTEPNGTEEIYPTALMNGVVDLGTLTWTYRDNVRANLFSTSFNDKYSLKENVSALCEKYSYGGTVTGVVDMAYKSDKTFCLYYNVGNTNGNIYIIDSSYTDATAFKNAMNGVLLYYERNVSTPYTSPILADITYYNTTDSAVPYRKFWMINAKGERWNLTERDLKTFLNNPQGLGFAKTLSVSRYGNTQMLVDSTDNFPNPQGDILFYDSSNKTRYERYNDFVRFLSYFPVTLYYQIPATYYSRIPDIYSLECEVLSLTKTESKPEHILTAQISMNGLSFYKGDEVIINGTGSTYTIENPSDFPVGFEITITGTSMENPYFTLEQDNSLYGEAKFNDTVGFDSVYVNSRDGEQNIELQQGGSVMPNPLMYQDLSISNGAIYVTFVALARGTSTLTIGMDSGSITSANIKFTPLYRSV